MDTALSFIVWSEGRFEFSMGSDAATTLDALDAYCHIKRAETFSKQRRRKTEEGPFVPPVSNTLDQVCICIVSALCEELERHAWMEILAACSIKCDAESQLKRLQAFRDLLTLAVERSEKWSALIDAPHQLLGIINIVTAIDEQSVTQLESTVKKLAEIWSSLIATVSFQLSLHDFDKGVAGKDNSSESEVREQVLSLLAQAMRQHTTWASDHGPSWLPLRERTPLRIASELPGESTRDAKVSKLGRTTGPSFTGQSNKSFVAKPPSFTGRTSNNRLGNNKLLLAATLVSSSASIAAQDASPPNKIGISPAKARFVDPFLASSNISALSSASNFEEDPAFIEWCSSWSAWTSARMILLFPPEALLAEEVTNEAVKASSLTHFHHLDAILRGLQSRDPSSQTSTSALFVSPELLERQLICSSPERLRRLSSCPSLLMLPSLMLWSPKKSTKLEPETLVEAGQMNQPKQLSPFANSNAKSRSPSPDRLKEVHLSHDKRTLLDGVMALELALFTCRSRKSLGLDGFCTRSVLISPGATDDSTLYAPSLIIARHLVHPHLSQSDYLLLGSSQPLKPASLSNEENTLPPLSPLPLTPAGVSPIELSTADLYHRSFASLSRVEGIRAAARTASPLSSHSALEKILMSALGVVEVLDNIPSPSPVNKSLPCSKLGPAGSLLSPLLLLMVCLASDTKDNTMVKASVDSIIPPHTMAALSQVIAVIIGSCQGQCNHLLQTFLVYPSDASMRDAIVAHSNGLELFIAAHDLLRAIGDLARYQWRSITSPLVALASRATNNKRTQGDSAGSLAGGVGGWLGSAAPDGPEGPDETLSCGSSQTNRLLIQVPKAGLPQNPGGAKGMFNNMWAKKKNKISPLPMPLPPPSPPAQPDANPNTSLSSINQQEPSLDSAPHSPAASLDRSNVTAQQLSPGSSLHTSWELVKVLELQQGLLVSVRGCVFGLQKKLVAAMVNSIAKAYAVKSADAWLPRTEPDSATQGTIDVVKVVLSPLRHCLIQEDHVHAQSRAFCSQAAWGLVLQALEGRVQSGARRASTISPSLMPLIKRQVHLDCEELKAELGEYQGLGSRRVLSRQTSGLSPGIIAVLNKQLDSINEIIRL